MGVIGGGRQPARLRSLEHANESVEAGADLEPGPSSWPTLTAPARAWRGTFRERPEDFLVEEVPIYAAAGSGDHVFFQVEKRGVTTLEAVRMLARALGRGPRDIGFAGMKDAQAVTRQWMSLEHVDPARLEGLELGPIRVRAVTRHKNKLKLGHLSGNRFELKLRHTHPSQDAAGRSALDELVQRGVPNYFGPQRFGVRGDSWKIGRALLAGDFELALAHFVGRPGPLDSGSVLLARQHFDAGRYEAAARTWPRSFRDASKACMAMARKRTSPKQALFALDRSLLRLFVSAYQSQLFNALLARRIAGVDQVLVGDLAFKHANGAVFSVQDLQAEAARAQAFEISPTGPLFGSRMTRADGEPGRLEEELLQRAGHRFEDFAHKGSLEWQGARRPLRMPLSELAIQRGTDGEGDFLALAFRLPAGGYATSLLREVLASS